MLVPQVAYGYFPANAEGNDLIIWTDEPPRRAHPVPLPPPADEPPCLCIADFFRPWDGGAGEPDYAAFHIVTMGGGISRRPPACSPRTATRTT